MEINTIDMLLEMIKEAGKVGEYDAFDDLELEYQEIVKKAKDFHKKIEKIYKEFKKEVQNENKK